MPAVLRLGRAAIHTAVCERAWAQAELDRIAGLGPLPAGLELEYLRQACELHNLFSDSERMKPLLERLLALSRQTGFPQGTAYGLYYTGLEIINNGNYREAIATFASALDVEKDLTDAWLLGEIYNDIGFCYRRIGDPGRAEEGYRRSLEIRERSGNLQGQAESLSNLGFLKIYQGDLGQAETLLTRALQLEQRIGDRISSGYTLVNMGFLAYKRGQFQRSRQYHRRALELRTALDDHLGQGHCYLQLRALADVEDDGAEELRLYNLAYHAFIRAGDATGQLETKLSFAEYWLNNDRPATCQRILNRQSTYVETADNDDVRKRHKGLSIMAAIARRDGQGVRDQWGRCETKRLGSGQTLPELDTAASVEAFLGNTQHAIELRERMLAIAERQGDHFSMWRYRFYLGRLRGPEGRSLVEAAAREFKAMGAARLARRAEGYLREQTG
ncbi:MAG: tetratricopeptide repeat protein [Candidatus Edwardsbacteria bacterium]|nr:tetratricopeptide repeat protein [Candidatus Edwardsbacteria bacterium]